MPSVEERLRYWRDRATKAEAERDALAKTVETIRALTALMGGNLHYWDGPDTPDIAARRSIHKLLCKALSGEGGKYSSADMANLVRNLVAATEQRDALAAQLAEGSDERGTDGRS